MNMKKIIFWILVLFLLFGIGGYLLFSFYYSDEYFDNPLIEAVDYDLKEAEDLLEKFGFNKRFGCSTIAQGKYDETFKMIVALNQIDSSKIKHEECSKLFLESSLNKDTDFLFYQGDTGVCFQNSSTNVISYDDLGEVYKYLYGKDLLKKNINGLDINHLLFVFYDYDHKTDSFIEMSCNGCGGSCYSDHIREIKTAKLKGDYLIITFYDYESGLFELNDDLYFLSTSKGDKTFKCTYNEECMDIIKRDYLDLLDEYEVIFEKKDDHFTFKKFSKKEFKKKED